tara:strand:+ start:659 stop:1135 length:477 start_codon:yes stop_codon:yes gene_type:complete
MSYKISKIKNVWFSTNDPSAQTISTSYTEIEASKVSISLDEASDILYQFSFYLETLSASDRPPFLHIKLQKSSDNFASDVQDVEGCQLNVSGDDSQSDYYYSSVSPMFIVSNFNDTHLRIVARSYSATTETSLHISPAYDGLSGQNVKYYPSAMVVEL